MVGRHGRVRAERSQLDRTQEAEGELEVGRGCKLTQRTPRDTLPLLKVPQPLQTAALAEVYGACSFKPPQHWPLLYRGEN